MRVLMVCLGNICRSPTAHAVMESRLAAAGLGDRIEVDSAGTGDWHVGKAPDARAQQAGLGRGYDLSALRARQLVMDDFHQFDYLLAMDHNNLAHMQQMAPAGLRERIHLMLSPLQQADEVPDPYYGAEDGFDEVLDLVEAACDAWVDEFRRRLESRH
ncbi:MAG: low molecular weight protein-tyrosine-phosphatase [Pseudomonadota bacterium]